MNKSKTKGMILDVERKMAKVKVLTILMYVVLIVVASAIFIPVCWILLSSLKDTKEFLQIPPTFLPKKLNLYKFIDIWKKSSIGTAYVSTIIMVGGMVVSDLIINGLAGYTLSRLKPKGFKLVLAIVVWLMMVPHNLSMVPKFISFVNLGLTDSYIPFWMTAGCRAFNVLLFKDFFDTIPNALVEAARIDGCSELKIFFRIIIPLSKPIVMTISIFGFTAGWGDFLFPYLLIKEPSMQPIATKLYTLTTVLPPDEYMVVLIWTIIPPLIIFFVLQKYIMNGMEGGGVKE